MYPALVRRGTPVTVISHTRSMMRWLGEGYPPEGHDLAVLLLSDVHDFAHSQLPAEVL